MIWYVHCIMRPFNLISRKSVFKKQHYVWVQRTPLPVIWGVAMTSNQSNSMICPYWFSTFVLSVGGFQFIFITRHLYISAGMKKHCAILNFLSLIGTLHCNDICWQSAPKPAGSFCRDIFSKVRRLLFSLVKLDCGEDLSASYGVVHILRNRV